MQEKEWKTRIGTQNKGNEKKKATDMVNVNNFKCHWSKYSN